MSSSFQIASKYVERQVLFHRDDIDARVKFDFTYTILLSSVTPLRLHAYKHFFMRFGNKYVRSLLQVNRNDLLRARMTSDPGMVGTLN